MTPDNEFPVTIEPRKYKCTPRHLTALSAEWMGKEIVPTIPSDNEITFEFPRKEYAEGFFHSLKSYKI